MPKPSEANSSFLKPCQRKNTFALNNDSLPTEEWEVKADHLSDKTPMQIRIVSPDIWTHAR